MNKGEIVAAIAEKSGLSKSNAEKALVAFTDVVTENLAKGETLQLIGFGSFKTVEKAAHTSKSFGVVKEIPAKTIAKFQVGSKLAEAVNVPKKPAKKGKNSK